MKFSALLLVAALAVPVSAAPVHVALKSAAQVQPNADGFFTLGSVADLTGGDKSARTRLAAVSVGRAPLSGETRRVTRGDLALKLRQAGCNPDTQAVLEGAEQASVTVGEVPPVPNNVGVGAGSPRPSSSLIEGQGNPAPTSAGRREVASPASSPLVHRGDAVTIVIQSGALTITALGVAREDGRAGDSIRIHREGVMTDLTVQIVDAKTVQLEI